MLQKLLTLIFGNKYERDLKALLPILHKVNDWENWALALKDADFPAETTKLKERLAAGGSLDDLLPEAFALAREACRRVLGERPYDVQILGGINLHKGRITEMKTGEGKTLTSVTAAYLNALSGKGVHVVTVNDYLAERDSQWMGRVHNFLGLSVGVILSTMDAEARQKSYSCDITYATNNELGFDYLRDNMRWDSKAKSQRSHNFCIIDEIDSILIDEARTPLIISGAVEEDTTKISEIDKLVKFFDEVKKDPETGLYPVDDPLVKTVADGDYKLDEKNKRIIFTDPGMNKMEKLLTERGKIKGTLFDEQNFEWVHYFTQAMKAHLLFHKDVDYIVDDDKVLIVDEHTGRTLHGRRYNDGLHQAIEAKESIRVAKRNVTLATITFQNFFRMYAKMCGMTGTADTEAREFAKIYNLDVAVIPSNRPLARIDEQDEIYLNEQFKFEAIAKEIGERHKAGQPILVGTVSVEKSEALSKLLTKRGVRHEVLNAKNHGREALIIAEAGAKGSVTIATNMAGRGTDIKLGGNPEQRARRKVGTEASEEEYQTALKKELLKWQDEYNEVLALGGLYVVGTERHESRRIDNQLRGRSGRQGDAGRSKFFISLDDDLMRLFGGERFRGMMARLGMNDGEALQHPMLSRSIERAQKRVEDRNYEIRKHLLDYDDILNKQRTYIYEVRNSVLTDEAMKERILRTGVELATELVEAKNKTNEKLLEDLKQQLNFIPSDTAEFLNKNNEARKAFIAGYLTQDLNEKEALTSSEVLNQFIRYEYLRALDDKWQNHLEAMEGLREAVGLRSYAQKNPLVEYKIEGSNLFNRMLDDIPPLLAAKIFQIRIQKAPAVRTSKVIAGEARHNSMGNLDAMRTKSGERSEANAAKVTVRRTEPKVGRNDPCPCGSGKKYKFCHGAGK
ncbi:MAG: preprotein translocase subunit SecA [Spirochaetaceae bacterium]|nr:preprotein translocase subunit SecA [Spirochaetaceae bacterium]